MQGGNSKRNNDPWVPLEDEKSTSEVIIAPAPLENPLHQMIDSEKYIQSLEAKLKKLTKAKQKEPTSREIITSLALFRDDQMRRYVDDSNSMTMHIPDNPPLSDAMEEHGLQSNYVARRLHPEKQPLNAEEIAELVKEDVMAKEYENDPVGGSNRLTAGSNAAGSNVNNKDLDSETAPTDSSNSNASKTNPTPSFTNTSGSKSTLSQHNEITNTEENAVEAENWANFEEQEMENNT